MFDGKKREGGMYFGPDGAMTSAFGGTAFVNGSGDRDGVYTRFGNSVIGPHGVTSLFGDGPVRTAMGPDGVHTIINNGSVSTIMGQDGVHTIFHNNGGGIVL